MAFAALLAGCADDGAVSAHPSRDRPTLDAGDFSGGRPTTQRGTPRREPPAPTNVRGELDAKEGILDVGAKPGQPGEGIADPRPLGEAVLVDATVGEINGKPIRASTVLPEVADRLRAAATDRGMTRPRWRQVAEQTIYERLRGMVTDELLRAEALAALTPEQKQGFLAFLEQQQKKFIATHLGSRELSKQKAREEGKTLEAWQRDAEQRRTVQLWLEENVYTRVQISRREMEQYYNAHYAEFNPAPKARLRRITVPLAKPAEVERVKSWLASGRSFKDVAEEPINRYDADVGGLFERVLKGSQHETEFFTTRVLNDVARRLEPGRWEGPIDNDGDAEWLYLEAIEANRRSFYESQLEIEHTLRAKRQKDLIEDTITRIMERANYTALDAMTERLLEIAERQYFPSPASAAAGVAR